MTSLGLGVPPLYQFKCVPANHEHIIPVLCNSIEAHACIVYTRTKSCNTVKYTGTCMCIVNLIHVEFLTYTIVQLMVYTHM